MAESPRILPADSVGLDEAVALLESGEVVAVPTDTVYGFACLPGDRGAIARMIELKARPTGVGLQVLAADVSVARSLAADWSGPAETLALRYWPGGITLVVRRAAHLDWELGGNAATIGLRCPDHEVARALLARVGPLAATSANLHGKPPMLAAREIAAAFPGGAAGLAAVVEGGLCDGEPSTVVDVTGDGPLCKREGRIAWSEILSTLEEGARSK